MNKNIKDTLKLIEILLNNHHNISINIKIMGEIADIEVRTINTIPPRKIDLTAILENDK